MTEIPAKDRARGRRDSTAAQHLDGLFEEMRSSEARAFLMPIVKAMRTKNGVKDTDNSSEILKKDLQQLAVAWKLAQTPDFWKQYPTMDDLLRVLYKHAKKLRETNPAAPHMEALHAQPMKSKKVALPKHPADWRKTLAQLQTVFKVPEYTGDLFNTRGSYHDGIIYMSRSTTSMQPGAADASSAGMPSAMVSARRSAADIPGDRDMAFPDGDDVANNSHAFEALRLSSTATLVEISQNIALREELADPSAIQILFDTWRSATHPQIRRNCALAISNLYSTLEMFHDDLMLPVLGLCTPDSSVAELSACSRALSRRALLPRPIDVIFIPSLLTAVISIIRRDGVTPLMRAECVLVLLQLLDTAQDNAEGNPESLIEAVNTLVTGGLSQVAASAKSPRKESSPTGKGSESPRKMANTKVLSRGSSFRNAVITPQASLAAAQAAKALCSRPSFRLTASLTAAGGEGSSGSKHTLSTNVEAEEIDDDASSDVSLPNAPPPASCANTGIISTEAPTQPEPFDAVRIAMEYGLLGVVVSIAKVCQDSLASTGTPLGIEATAKPRGAAACVPQNSAPDLRQPLADMDATNEDAVYLTDAIEYSVACLLRVALVPAFLGELANRHVVHAAVSLLNMRRTSIRDGAARILFVLAGNNDTALVQEIANNQETVQALAWVAFMQAQDIASSPPSPRLGTPAAESIPLTVASSLYRLAARAILSLSCIPNMVFALVSAKAGDALLSLYHLGDHLTRRWALLALCNLFELSEHGREDLLKLGFLPIMVDTVNIAVAEAENGGYKQASPPALDSGTLVTRVQGKQGVEDSIDRFAALDAATSCALAICALTAGNREVVMQLLANGTLRMLSPLLGAARTLLREGIAGLGALTSLPKRQRRASGGPEAESAVHGHQQEDAYMGMPQIWHPKVLHASVNAIAHLARLPECTSDMIVSAGDRPILDSLVGCVPSKPYLTHGTTMIPRHISDSALADWAAAEKGIQVQAVSALCSLCTFSEAQQTFASRANQIPSALEVLCRVGGAVPLNVAHTGAPAPPNADQTKLAQPPVIKAPLVRQPSVRLGRSASATNDDLLHDVTKNEVRDREKGRDRPKPFVWDTVLKEQAAYCLCVLSAISSCHAPLIRLGCIPLFIANIRHVHSRMRQECAQAIYNVTCTAVSDVPSTEGREAVSGYGISRVKLLIDADIAAALTIGSLFRADDDATRDLCAAAMHNVLSTTFILQHKEEEKIAQSSNGTSREDASQDLPAGILNIQQLRSRLLRDGLLWAVIKLTQGLHNKEEGHTAVAIVSSEADTQEDAAFARLMQGRYITTARIMRNLAVDPSTVAEVAKRHSVVMLYWYARQCAQVLGVDVVTQRRALALANRMTEQARRALIASFNVIADDDAGQTAAVKVAASREHNGVPPNAPHPIIVPSLLLTCSQICSSLSAQTSVLPQLVSHGFVVGVARLLDVAGDLVETLDGTSQAELSIAVSIAHRIAVAFKNLTLHTGSAAAMLQQGPLCVSVVYGLLTCVLGILAVTRVGELQDDQRIHLDALLADAEGIIVVPLRRALVSIVSCASSSLAALSAIPSAANLLSEQGAVDCSMKLCALACASDDAATLHELMRTPTIEMTDPTQELPLREFIVDCALRCIFNLLANPSGVGMDQARKAYAGGYVHSANSSSDLVCDMPTPKDLLATLVSALAFVAPSPTAPPAAYKRHAARMVCTTSMMSQLTADSHEDLIACKELHDALLLSRITELCKLAPEPSVREGAAIAFANICSSNPSKYLPTAVITFLTETLAATQFTATSNRPSSYAAVSRSRTHKAGEKQDVLNELTLDLLSLQHSAAAALLRCVSLLLRARPTLDSKANELVTMTPDSVDMRPAVITEEGKLDSWVAALSPPDNASTPSTNRLASQLPGSVETSPTQMFSESATITQTSLRRSSSFGGPPGDEISPIKPQSQKNQVSQASLLALKSLIDREHEEMARRARHIESPHLRPFIESGIIPTIASIAVNTRSLLRARMQLQQPRPQQMQKDKSKTDATGGGSAQRSSSAGRFRPQSARRASKALDSSKAPPPSLVQEAVKWTNPSTSDRHLSQFIAVMQYLCSECLLAISRSPDAKGCLFGLDMQGPRPLTITFTASMPPLTGKPAPPVMNVFQQRQNLVSMLGMRPAAGIDAMMALAKSGRIVLERLMAEAMAYLTQTHDHRVRFLQERAATVLATLARRSTMDTATQKWCTMGLKNLSDDVKLRSSVLEAGGVVQGVLMLLPDEAETAEGAQDASTQTHKRTVQDPNTASFSGKNVPYDNVGPGLDLGDVFEIDGDTEDHDSVWSEEESESVELAEETAVLIGASYTADASNDLENALQLTAFRVPRPWLPGESCKSHPSHPDLDQVRLLTGSGVLPDADAVTDWTINGALVDVPHSPAQGVEDEVAPQPRQRPISLKQETINLLPTPQGARPKCRWNDLLFHRTASFAEELPTDSLAAHLRQAMTAQRSDIKSEESKLPDSAFRHRVHFEKTHAYDKILPRDVTAADLPDYSCSIVTSDLGLTDAVAKEIASAPTPEHAARSSEDLTKHSLALLKPFALPDSELSALLLGHGSGSQHKFAATSPGDCGGYLVSNVAYTFLAEFPDRNMQTPQLSPQLSPHSGERGELPFPGHSQVLAPESKDAVIIRLSGRFDGTKLREMDGDVTKMGTGRKRIRTLNDPWREPDDLRDTQQQASIFHRLHSRMDSRDSFRHSTVRQAQGSRGGVKLPDIPKSPEYATVSNKSARTPRYQPALQSSPTMHIPHESSSPSLPRLKPL